MVDVNNTIVGIVATISDKIVVAETHNISPSALVLTNVVKESKIVSRPDMAI